MDQLLYISALTLGLASSFHCVGMCGPLMATVFVSAQSEGNKWMAIVLYHSGRIMTYVILGFVAALVGWRLQVTGWQQVFSIVVGSFMLVGFFGRKYLQRQKWIKIMNNKITGLIEYAMRIKNGGGIFLLGMANGLLPCGMVYLAMGGALATGNLLSGSLFMGLFGVGTLPLLIFFSWTGIRLRHKQIFRRIMPIMIVMSALLIILRGMNIGIPYLSPSFSNNPATVVSCH